MKKKILGGILTIAMLAMCAGCGSQATDSAAGVTSDSTSQETDSTEKSDGKDLKFVYISKQLTHPWFVQEEMGIKKACDELGIEYVGIDSDGNDEKCLSDIDSSFSMQADALLMCITNQSMGPNVAARCEEEGIPLVTIDDNILDADGNQVPHVGMPTQEVGERWSYKNG